MTTDTSTDLFSPEASGADAAAAGASAAGDAGQAGQADKGGDAANPAVGQQQDAAAVDAAKQGDKPAEGAKDAKAADKPAGAPEAYADFSAPEGYELDSKLLGDFTPKFKEWGLSQEQAQELLNMAPKLVDATVEKTTQAVMAAVGLADRGNWAQQVREDKQIGGEKVAENVAIARRGANALFSAETKAFLAKTGLGNHPAIVRDMHRYGMTLSEDGFVPGGKQTTPSAQGFFSKSSMNP